MIRAALGLAWLTHRTLFAGRRAAATGFLLLLPAVVAGAMAMLAPHPDGEEILHGMAFYYSLRFMIFLLALIFGMALTTGEIEEGTAGYIYLSALPKWLNVLIQISVAAVALTLLTCASLLATALAASLAGQGFVPNLPRNVLGFTLVAGFGILISLSFYATCGLAFRRPLAVAVIVTFLWELLITRLPVRFAAWTVTNNLRALMLHLVFEGNEGRWFRYVRNYELPTYGEASLFLSALAGVFLATAMVAVMNRSIQGKETH